MGLSRYEKETVIIFNDEEKFAHISSSQDWMKRRIKRYAEGYPDEVIITNEDEYTICAQMPKSFVSRVRPPRHLTEEQKQQATERLSKYWKEKKANDGKE